MVSPGNTHNCGIISTEQFTFRNMYAYTYTLMFAVKKKKGYELKIEQEGIYRRIWRVGREGENVIYYNLTYGA